MIIYTSTLNGFLKDVMSNDIEDKILDAFKDKLGHSTGKAEIASWKNSMQYMYNVVSDEGIPGDAGVAIEYRIPQTSKRIDFVLTGESEDGQPTAMLIELKQWSKAELSNKDGIVETFVGGRVREVNHPSYQVWSYSALMEDFNETIEKDDILLKPCAYLHNYDEDEVIGNVFYDKYLTKAPVFLRKDALRLREFIKTYIKHGDKKDLLYQIDGGKIRPSKKLADKLNSMLQGNQEFVMIDDQKLVYETALQAISGSSSSEKNVIIVDGGPGTGKSVVAINLLVAANNEQKLAQYVTKNSAPRTVYESKLTGTFNKSHISNLFIGSGSFVDTEKSLFDVLIVDEAHRLNAKSGMFQNKGENQIKEIIDASKCSIFFIDEDQRIALQDIGEKEEIRRWAKKAGAAVQELSLQSQFRCNGSDGYLAWLDNALQIRDTANENLDGIDYDFKVFESPAELRDTIYLRNKANNSARMVAGYCWKWESKKNRLADDIVFEKYGFAAKWNLSDDGMLWIVKPNSVKEVGCIHTCQGLELDYVGVIIGPDLIVRDGRIITDATKRAGSDKSVHGYKKLHKEDPAQAEYLADMIIKNTYRTLMTRGQKGCYVYSVDDETQRYFESLAN